MARIILNGGAPVSLSLLRLTSNIVAIKQQTDRLKAIMDQITNNGAVKVNLETSSETAVPVGTGAAIYDGVAQIQTALNGLASLVSAIDQNA